MSGAVSIEQVQSNGQLAPCISVVMPVFNEEATVARVVQHVLEQRPVEELIIVDDASRDGTWRVLQTMLDPRIRLMQHSRNQGKGAALRTGIAGAKSSIVLIQDADLEYDPTEYYLLLKPILSNQADVVYGSRFLGGGPRRVLYYWHSVGNKVLTTMSNMATNLNLSDMETCYKVFRLEVIHQIRIREDRFGFEPEITAKLSRLKNTRIYEVPVSYHGRTYAEGKKIGWRDGLSALRCIVKYNFFVRQ